MQPNQQDPTQSSTPSAPVSGGSSFGQQPFQTPDYLHLEPVVMQTKKPKKKKFVIAAICLVVFGLIGGGLFYWQSQQLTPNERFYQSLGKLMETSYITRSYSSKINSPVEKTTISTVVDTDFSNPETPKSYIQRTYNQNLKGAPQKSYNEESVVLDNSYYNILLKSGTPNVLNDGMKANQWYRIPLSPGNQEYSIDSMEPEQLLNTPQSILPIGNVGVPLSNQLVNYIEQHNTYPIINIQNIVKNNERLTEYTVQIDSKKINDLDVKFADILKAKQLYPMSANTSFKRLLIWTNNTTGMVVKIEYNNPDTVLTIQKTIDFSYPSKLAIPSPTNVEDLPS